jgi:hypothetical protein
MVGFELLHNAYEGVCERLIRDGVVVEPLRSVETVYRHRLYWKPAEVRVVLLAESHVFTPAAELENTVDLARYGHPGAPKEYARFVYCLGYGEDEIVRGKVPRNAGTWQYWRLFYACVNGVHPNETFAPVLKGETPDVGARVRNKLRVLSEMRRRGIWLVDASLLGLYVPAGKKASSQVMDHAITASWDLLWGDELRALAPRFVICIGYGVHARLEDRLRQTFGVRVGRIEQPNAMLSGARHLENLAACGRWCAEYAPG